jgi:hypothetical protein
LNGRIDDHFVTVRSPHSTLTEFILVADLSIEITLKRKITNIDQ